MKNYANTVFLNQLSVFLNIGVGLALLPFIQSHFGEAGLLAFGTLFGAKSFLDIGIGWINSGLAKKLLKDADLVCFRPYYTVNAIFCGVVICTMIALARFTVVDVYSAIFFTIYVCTIVCSGPLVQAFIGALKQHYPPALRISQQLIFCALLWISYLADELTSISDIFLLLSGSALLVYLVAHLKFRRMIHWRFGLQVGIMQILSEARPYLLTTVSTVFLLQLDFFLIMAMRPESEAARYYVVWKLASSILMFGWRFSEPYAAISKKDNFVIGWPKLPVLIASIGLPIVYMTCGEFAYEEYFRLPEVPAELILSLALLVFSNNLFRYYYSVSFYRKQILLSSGWQVLQVLVKATLIVFTDAELYIVFIAWALTDAIGVLILYTVLTHETKIYSET